MLELRSKLWKTRLLLSTWERGWKFLELCAVGFRLRRWMFGWMGKKICRARNIGSGRGVSTRIQRSILGVHIPILVKVRGQESPHHTILLRTIILMVED